jgi:hypothetical protein
MGNEHAKEVVGNVDIVATRSVHLRVEVEPDTIMRKSFNGDIGIDD